MSVRCPYCHNKAELLTSKQFYGRDYGSNVYVCRPCDARVGTHGRSNKPLGTLANANLRSLRMKCHKLIDPYWKRGKYTRSEVYKRLAKFMKLPPKETHIGMFDEYQCKKLISVFDSRKIGRRY